MLAEDCSVYALSSITLYWYHFLSTSYFLLLTPSASVAAVRIYENKVSCMTHLAHFSIFLP